MKRLSFYIVLITFGLVSCTPSIKFRYELKNFLDSTDEYNFCDDLYQFVHDHPSEAFYYNRWDEVEDVRSFISADSLIRFYSVQGRYDLDLFAQYKSDTEIEQEYINLWPPTYDEVHWIYEPEIRTSFLPLPHFSVDEIDIPISLGGIKDLWSIRNTKGETVNIIHYYNSSEKVYQIHGLCIVSMENGVPQKCNLFVNNTDTIADFRWEWDDIMAEVPTQEVFDEETNMVYIPYQGDSHCGFTDRYIVYGFDGNKFVCKGNQPNSHIHASLNDYKRLSRIYKNSKYTIRIDEMANERYRYASWSDGKEMCDTPDIILIGNRKDDKYIFENNGVKYVISDGTHMLNIFRGEECIYSGKVFIYI